MSNEFDPKKIIDFNKDYYFILGLVKEDLPTGKSRSEIIKTSEVLEKMAPIVNDYFRFKSLDEIEDVEKQFNDVIGDDEDDTNGFTDAADADDIFG